MPHLPAKLRIWEPAAGCGRIARALRAGGHVVEASDIMQGRDFLLAEEVMGWRRRCDQSTIRGGNSLHRAGARSDAGLRRTKNRWYLLETVTSTKDTPGIKGYVLVVPVVPLLYMRI